MSAQTAVPNGPINYDMAVIENRPANVALQFLERVRKTPNLRAYGYPSGDGFDWITWKESGDRVRRYAAGLLELGLGREERVGIVSSTRYEWILADLAVMCAGGATTTVYQSTNAEDTAFILSDSECRIVFAEDDKQLAKLNEQRASIPTVTKVVTFDPQSVAPSEGGDDWVIGLEDLGRLGDKRLAEKPGEIDEIAASIKPGALATLIYTSGTTGRPKGVRLRHQSWTYEGAVIEAQHILDENDLQFLWLPMAHSFGKVLLCAQLACGFPTAVDGRVDKIIDNLAVVKPTFMGAAPRIFEKAYSRIQTMQADKGGIQEKLFNQAFSVGIKRARLQEEGKKVPFLLERQYAVLDKLVLSKVRERFGGRVRFFISGAAALNHEVAEWFNAAGIQILEGYGLTETSAGAFVNHPDQNKFGTVGPVFPGSEVKIAEDGEILIRGPHVMEGYHKNEEATREALTEDGWFHTGDIGELDEDGHLRITDRKKDLFKTSGGKYIAPSAIESQFKAICPYASQFLVHGNERNFVVALVTLDPDEIMGWAAKNGMEGKSYSEVVTSTACRELVQGYVDTLNQRLNRWETIKKFIILDHDLTVESGELTPSMKVKRKVVEGNYSQQIDSLYG